MSDYVLSNLLECETKYSNKIMVDLSQCATVQFERYNPFLFSVLKIQILYFLFAFSSAHTEDFILS
jgi:hypothetical protein